MCSCSRYKCLYCIELYCNYITCLLVCQAELSDAVITDTGVTYLVTDKGEMMADNIDSQPGDTAVTGTPAGETVVTGMPAGDGADTAHVDVTAILVSAEVVMDVKKKCVCKLHDRHVCILLI